MEEKYNLYQQKSNTTLARFYDWIKQREKPIQSHMIRKTPVSKTDKEKNNVAFCSL